MITVHEPALTLIGFAARVREERELMAEDQAPGEVVIGPAHTSDVARIRYLVDTYSPDRRLPSKRQSRFLTKAFRNLFALLKLMAKSSDVVRCT